MGSFVVPFSKIEGPKIRVLPTKKRIEVFSLGNPYAQLFNISTIKITFKNNKFTGYITISVPKQTTCQFIATMNVYLNAKKSILSFNSVWYSCDPLL